MKYFWLTILLLGLCMPAFAAEPPPSDSPPRDLEKLKSEALESHQGYKARAIAKMYANGEGAPLDIVEAYAWYSLSAASENLDDFDALAEKMTPAEITEGKRRAAFLAEQEDKLSAKSIKGGAGVLCLRMLIVSVRGTVARCAGPSLPLPQNPEEAFFWLLLPKEQKDDAQERRVGVRLSQEQRLAVRKRVAQWKPVPEEQRKPDAEQQKILDRYSSPTNGIATEIRAENGDAQAQFDIGARYEYGLGQPQDFAAAEKWYLRAARQGQESAQTALGKLYSSTIGGDLTKEELLAFWSEQLLRVDNYIVRNSEAPTTLEALQAEEAKFKIPPYGCLNAEKSLRHGILMDGLRPGVLEKSLDKVLSVPGIPQMEPCL